MSQQSQSLSSDLIWGVDGPDGIAAFLGIDPVRAYYLIQRGKIPTRKLGHRTITASRAELRRFFQDEAGLPDAKPAQSKSQLEKKSSGRV
jgi:hypothetical protein